MGHIISCYWEQEVIMTINKGGRCEYCWNRLGQHNEGCPVEIGMPEAMEEWNRGYEYGFADNYWPYYWYSPKKTYVLGYIAGRAEIDRRVEIAVENNYSYFNDY